MKMSDISQENLDSVNQARKLLYIKRTFKDILSTYIGDAICMDQLKIIEKQISDIFSSENLTKIYPDVKIICDETNNSPESIDKYELSCTLIYDGNTISVTLKPINPGKES